MTLEGGEPMNPRMPEPGIGIQDGTKDSTTPD
jgi:hypothetical protein